MEILLTLILFFILNTKINNLQKEVRSGRKVVEKISVDSKTKNIEEQNENFDDLQNVRKEESSSSADIFEWLKKDWLIKLGAFLLILSFAWFIRYAFMENWIGPIGRITLGLISGALFLMLGEWQIKKSKNNGSVFMALGSGIILLTIFAAREFYNFFTPLTALIIMCLPVIYLAISSLINNYKSLAILSLLIGSIAPLLTNSDPSSVGLFSYLFLLCAGTIWVVAVSGWRNLTTMSLIIFGFYSLPYLTSSPFSSLILEFKLKLFFAFLFAMLFYLANLGAIIKTKMAEKTDLIAAGLNGLFLLAWINIAASEELKSLITAGTALFFVAGSFLVFKKTNLKNIVYLYSGIAALFIAVATAFELKGAALTIAYILEIGLLSFLINYIFKDLRSSRIINFLFLIPAAMSADSLFSSAWSNGFLNIHFFVLLIFASTLLTLGTYFQLVISRNKEISPLAYQLLFVGSGFYFMALVWLVLHSIILSYETATIMSLVIYTIFGVTAYAWGRIKQHNLWKKVGEFLLGIVALRLLVIDVWNMELTGRIIVFFLIGVLLISTALIKKSKKTT